MGYKHDKAEILAAALAVVEADGLANLTFGRVAKRLGINDRTVVYYFPTKADLLAAVLVGFAGDLQDLLDQAFGPEPLPAPELIARAWPTLSSASADRSFAVFFELLGLAAANQQPHADLAKLILRGWVDWVASRVQGDDAEERRRGALGVVASLDGLLLLRQILGADAAAEAAHAVGIEAGVSPARR